MVCTANEIEGEVADDGRVPGACLQTGGIDRPEEDVRNPVKPVLDVRGSGADVTVMDMTPPEAELPDVEWQVGSISDEAMLASLAGGRDTVVFLATSSLPASANADFAGEIPRMSEPR